MIFLQKKFMLRWWFSMWKINVKKLPFNFKLNCKAESYLGSNM